MITVKKLYKDYPAAHRQHNHNGHCSLIHGHNWSFEFEFACDELEEGTGFVVDFGKLSQLKGMLTTSFDHTILLSPQDPQFKFFCDHPLFDVRAVPNTSCEGLAQYLLLKVNETLFYNNDRGVKVIALTVYEDSKNSATYRI